MNRNVDQHFIDGCMRCDLGGTPECKVHQWTSELQLLRNIILDCGLTEESRWGVPCYTYEKGNVLLLSAFKEYCAVSFFKGSLLKDESGILDKPGANSQAARFIRFTEVAQIEQAEVFLKTCIFDAIEVEKAGLKVSFQKNPEPVPDELQQKLEEDPVFRTAFETLTPGRQRGYIIHFSQPKQPTTRHSRIEKCTEKILNGEGLHDRYRSMRN